MMISISLVPGGYFSRISAISFDVSSRSFIASPGLSTGPGTQGTNRADLHRHPHFQNHTGHNRRPHRAYTQTEGLHLLVPTNSSAGWETMCCSGFRSSWLHFRPHPLLMARSGKGLPVQPGSRSRTLPISWQPSASGRHHPHLRTVWFRCRKSVSVRREWLRRLATHT